MSDRQSVLHHGLGIAPDLDAHTYNAMQVIRTGEYWGGGLGFPRSWSLVLTANRLYAAPFVVARDMTFDRISVYVSTQAAGKVARCGLYENGTNNAPGALVVDGGEISVATTGQKTATISESVTKGLYWIGIVSDGTPTVRASSQSSAAVTAVLTSSDGYDFEIGWYVAHTYGALPDPFGTPTKYAAVGIPGVSLRVASLD